MPSFNPFLGLLSFSIIYVTVESDPNFLYNFCYENDTTIATNNIYKSNLNLLLSSLSSKSNTSDGYYNTTVGQQNSDKIYGMFLCRGDVTSDICQDCVTAAAQNLTRLCSIQRSSVIWYDECMLRYSNRSFFSTQDSRPSVLIWENKTVTEDQGFINVLASLVRDLSAAAENAPAKFATKEAKFNGSQTLYSLAQCTPDLSNFDCNLCLQTAITDLPNCCAPSQGATQARSMLTSCNIQYGLFPFYNKTAGEAPESEPSPPGKGKSSSQKLIYIIVPTLGTLAVVSTFCYCILKRKLRKTSKVPKYQSDTSKSITMQSLQFNQSTIEAATNNFSDANKIGVGGFGSVYKGVLANGQEIAVKRLSRSSKQGAVEFKNEMVLVAKLQHRNLVRLLGFCVEGEERMLVYEFMPNKSLDYFLFDSEKQKQLDWSMRYKIIKGTARGLLYLHMDSRLKIIHRDLKPSNVLLDGDMNPRISDFGMARIVEENEDIEQTRKVVGTYGYISPEYALQGMFSFKSDVYSFGVMTLEIVSGRRNTSFCNRDCAEDLLSLAWTNWNEGNPLVIMDPSIRDSFVSEEVIRCIQIGLLCVQQNPKARPTMAKIVAVLGSSAVSLPPPQQPAFLFGCKTAGSSSVGEMELDQSTSKSKCSVNQASYSEFYPR